MDHALGHRQGAIPDVDGQQPFPLGVHRHPDPLGRPLQALDRLGRADLPGLDRAEQGAQLIKLPLPHPHVVEDVSRKRLKLLGRFDQPLQHGIGGDLEHPRGAADAQALSEAADHVHDAVDRDALAMEQGTVMLWKGAFAGRTVELTPRATVGMAVGAQVAQPQPAAVVTVRMRAKMRLSGILRSTKLLYYQLLMSTD